MSEVGTQLGLKGPRGPVPTSAHPVPQLTWLGTDARGWPNHQWPEGEGPPLGRIPMEWERAGALGPESQLCHLCPGQVNLSACFPICKMGGNSNTDT